MASLVVIVGTLLVLARGCGLRGSTIGVGESTTDATATAQVQRNYLTNHASGPL